MAVTQTDSLTKSAELRLFGSVELRDPGGRAISDIIVRPRLLGVLAYISSTGDSFIRREKLLEIFWPEYDEDHSRGALRTSLYRIRNSFGSDPIEVRGADELRLRPDAVWCDVQAFEAAIAKHDWQNALPLYRGELLDGFHLDDAPSFERWLDEKRARCHSLAVHAARELTKQLRAQNDMSGALKWATVRLELAPDEETACRELMSLHADLGDKGAALNVFETFSNRLREIHQAEPSKETRDLAERLRQVQSESPKSGPSRQYKRAAVSHWQDRTNSVAIRLPAAAAPTRTYPARRNLLFVGIAIAVLILTAVLKFGGTAASTPTANAARRWELVTVASRPIGRTHASFVYDAARNEGVLFGGRQNESALADLWRLHNANGIGGARWERIATTGPTPGARWIHEAHYDRNTDRMIVFGGAAGYTSPCTNDTWILEGAMRGKAPLTWTKIDVPGGPAPRAELASVYDPTSNRLVVYGGHDCIAPIFDDLWILTNANGIGKSEWIRVHPKSIGGSPGPRRSHSLVYDAAKNRAMLFGGSSDYSSLHFQNDAWVLTHANGLGGIPEWKKLVTLGPSPEPRLQHRAVFDAETNRLAIIGGERELAPGGEAVLDGWVLTGANGTTPSSTWKKIALSETPRLLAFSAVYDPGAERIIVFGGATVSAGRVVENSQLRILSNPLTR